MDISPFFVFGCVFLLIAGLWVYGYLSEKKRREAFRKLAEELGWTFRSANDSLLPSRYAFLNELRKGSNRYARNILEGEWEGFPIRTFDYHYETYSTDSKGRRQTHHHWLSLFVLEMKKPFPELLIYPEGFFAKIGQFLGFEDIDFESIEFSKTFVVKSTDKRFAYDVCHPRMMDYLLKHRDLSIEIEDRFLSLSFSPLLSPEEIPDRLQQLVSLRKLLPDYLFRE